MDWNSHSQPEGATLQALNTDHMAANAQYKWFLASQVCMWVCLEMGYVPPKDAML